MKITKEINKIIEPYIVKRSDGQCCLLIPLGTWDDIVHRILYLLKEKEIVCPYKLKEEK